MILYPNDFFNNVREIKIEYLNKHNIKALILDVDNTLINYYKEMEKGTKEWCQDLKNKGNKMYILSNSNKRNKVEKIAKDLQVPFRYFAKKPLKSGFKKAQKELGLKSEEIAVIGDQLLTDIIGANRCRMYSILVNPIKEKDIWITRLKRPIEKMIMKNYKKGRN